MDKSINKKKARSCDVVVVLFVRCVSPYANLQYTYKYSPHRAVWRFPMQLLHNRLIGQRKAQFLCISANRYVISPIRCFMVFRIVSLFQRGKWTEFPFSSYVVHRNNRRNSVYKAAATCGCP